MTAIAETSTRPRRDEQKINIRAPQRDLDMIDRAAREIGQNRSSFMLRAAVESAEAVLLDKRLFELDEQEYQRFLTRLDEPPKVNVTLRQLLARKAPWES